MEYLSYDIEPNLISAQNRVHNQVMIRQMANHSKEIRRNHCQVVFFSMRQITMRLFFSTIVQLMKSKEDGFEVL